VYPTLLNQTTRDLYTCISLHPWVACAMRTKGAATRTRALRRVCQCCVDRFSILAAMGLPAGATTVYWAALVCGGIAIVNLASLVVFDVALTLTHLHTPRILRDL